MQKLNFLKPGEGSEGKKNHIPWYILSHQLNNGGQDEVRKDVKQHAGWERDRALISMQKTICLREE